MKQLLPAFCALLVFAICSAQAADESIDRLISKLPPPQKFVDPAITDPAAKQINDALKAHNFGVALDLSRRLASRYPKSLGAQMVHGTLAMSVRQFREASDAYQKALSIRPDFPVAYLGLAFTDMVQNKFGAALSDFQRVTRTAPQLDIGWVGSSACAEKLGRKRDSLEFAKRGTTAAPSSALAWFQLAREEGLNGDKQAAQTALARANQLRRNAPRAKTR